MKRLTINLPQLKLKNSIIAFFCAALQAFGMYNIHALSDLTEGGVLGATLLINHFFHISPGISGFIMNGALFILGWKTLGKQFIAYSLFATFGFSFGYSFCEQFPPLWPGIAERPLLASISGAIFIGVGAGFCVRAGGATSGDDALAMSLTSLTKGKLKIQWIYLISDLAVLLLSLSYIPFQKISYSILTVIISGQLIGLIQNLPTHSTKTIIKNNI